MFLNQLKTILLLAALSALLVGAGAAIGPGAFWLFTALALGMNLFSYFWSDKLVLRMNGARELPRAEAPRLHALVEELALRAGLPKPRVFFVDDPAANAFATGRNPERAVVAVTRGLVELLDERELRGVLAHEVAHVRNRDILVASVAAGIATAVSSVANLLAFTGLFGGAQDEEGSPGGNLLFMLVAPIGATLVQLGISRSREYLADETGARLTGDPLALASALARLQRSAEVVPAQAAPATASLFIVNPFGGALAGLARLFSTHPPAEERIRRLEALARELGQPPRLSTSAVPSAFARG
ncbi:MAG: zinc metalloprotease HtpX [Anaeromyxobacter sp.]|nr:zinc metalloprotease HtpX [Anaeromyxobacter sp.]MBL0275486.1 zinc metalloprotease HtpX [Anaeromyxobacter sp.]